jgi:predicted site-specific integrase-resolvase
VTSPVIWPKKKESLLCPSVLGSLKKDLERQVEIFDRLYPRTAIIKDIGSRLNFKRKSLPLLNLICFREIKEIIVLYNDRL